jgi:hypothetical protein
MSKQKKQKKTSLGIAQYKKLHLITPLLRLVIF